jgi:hypothetical protein
VLAQERFSVSKRYQVFATPFAFLIDEQGIIASKGIITNRQHIGYVLSGAGAGDRHGHAEADTHRAASSVSEEFPALSPSKEVSHV